MVKWQRIYGVVGGWEYAKAGWGTWRWWKDLFIQTRLAIGMGAVNKRVETPT